MVRWIRFAWLFTAAFLLLTIPASGQIRVGETSTRGSGTLSSGYSASYGNMTNSAHGWTIGGAASLSGSFHSPNFLSYDFSPYLNQSRANSNFQSISNSSGLNLNFGIFTGSKFPGTVTWSKAYNSEGNYAVPGLANFVTHGNSDTFGIGWSENIPDAPSFSAGYQTGSSHYSVYGSSNVGKNSFHALNLHSGYRWAGFNMGAYFTAGGGESQIPPVVSGGNLTIHTTNTSYGYNLTHLLPIRGNFAASLNRSTWDDQYLGIKTTGAIDTVNGSAGIHPSGKLSLSASASYSDNLTGQIIQSVVGAGAVVPGLDLNQSSSSLDLMADASYSPISGLQTSAFFERRAQSYLGADYGVKSYGGSASYSHKLLSGIVNSSVNVTANSSDNSGANTIGYSITENYSSSLLGWRVNESFSYAQNVQTLLVTYMNSYYNYSGNVSRRWKLFSMGVGGGGARTALTSQAGTANSSQTYNGSMGYGSFLSATASYSKSDGQALLTSTGLVGVPVPSPVLPSDLVSLFGGKSYSFGLASTPLKKFTLGATYGKSDSNTSSSGFSSRNQNSQYNAIVQYEVRKLNFVSGYARLEQGFSSTGSRPEVISSYYMGISRWFNFF